MMEFYRGKKVLITGHTGFKGTWLIKYLQMAGAEVTGYSLEPSETNQLYIMTSLSKQIKSVYSDIRDLRKLNEIFHDIRPEIVFHLAAQPIVKIGFDSPTYTYDVNVMGTVNLLECIRNTNSVKSVVNITTDKVYENKEWCWGYRESDALGGYDPYSNSKACSELITTAYKRSFFGQRDIGISTARAGNVIGGGDFADSRIVPDCYRALISGNPLILRNPQSIRPYQYVLESIDAYLKIAMEQFLNANLCDSYNIGPLESRGVQTIELVKLFEIYWGNEIQLQFQEDSNFHETNLLSLDSSKINSKLGWTPKYRIETALEDTVYFYRKMYMGLNVDELMEILITKYFI